MYPIQGCRTTPYHILSWATIAVTGVLLVPLTRGAGDVGAGDVGAGVGAGLGAVDAGAVDAGAEVLFPGSGRSARTARSISSDEVFFKAAKSLPRIGKRVNNNEIFPGVRRLLKPLPRVGRSSHDGDDNFLLKGSMTSDVFKAAEAAAPDAEPHQVVRRAGTYDTQSLMELDFLKGFKALPRIGRRDGLTNSDQSEARSSEDSESARAEKRLTPPLTQSAVWSNGDMPWFRQQEGQFYPSKKSGLADLVRLSALPWEDAVMKEKPQEAPLTVVTLSDDRDTPEAWHYNIVSDSAHRLE